MEQGELLLNCIDPSVSNEDDPLSVDPGLAPYRPGNDFEEPPARSHYSPEFVVWSREVQRQRVALIDARARRWVAEVEEARSAFKRSGDIQARRRSLAPPIVTVYQTDADLRCVDLSIDPSDRPYGSLFGRSLTSSTTGWGVRAASTPEAWPSTWSGLSANAGFRQTGADVKIPARLVEL
ncbi:MAG: alpha/beta hydrolase, partial [Acidimicrobiales bacterium]